MIEIETRNSKETRKVARFLAEEIMKTRGRSGLRIIALQGNLGSGKTTFAQGFAKACGVKKRVASPTFVIMKIYQVGKKLGFKYLAHVDCYRLKSGRDLLRLGFRKLLEDEYAIIVIEWAEKIKSILPVRTLRIFFKHGMSKGTRIISLKP